MARRVALAHALLVLAALPAGADQDPGAEVARLVSERRFAAAFAACEAIGDPVARAEACTDVRWYAGDLGGALRTGREGLARAPEHLGLLWRATRLATDLALPEVAARSLERLRRAVEDATELDAESRGAWRDSVAELAGPVERLEESRRARERALTRARVVVGAIAVAVAGAWATLARR